MFLLSDIPVELILEISTYLPLKSVQHFFNICARVRLIARMHGASQILRRSRTFWSPAAVEAFFRDRYFDVSSASFAVLAATLVANSFTPANDFHFSPDNRIPEGCILEALAWALHTKSPFLVRHILGDCIYDDFDLYILDTMWSASGKRFEQLNIVDRRIEKYGTPLNRAIISGRNKIIFWLLNHGANVQLRDHQHWNALLHAISRSDQSCNVLEVLIQFGADVNGRHYHGLTPLHLAIQIRSRNAVSLLLEHGANIFATDDFGHTPLDDAMHSDDHRFKGWVQNIKEMKDSPVTYT